MVLIGQTCCKVEMNIIGYTVSYIFQPWFNSPGPGLELWLGRLQLCSWRKHSRWRDVQGEMYYVMYIVHCTLYKVAKIYNLFWTSELFSVVLSTHTINFSRWAILAATAHKTQHVTRPFLPFARNLPQAQKQHLLQSSVRQKVKQQQAQALPPCQTPNRLNK